MVDRRAALAAADPSPLDRRVALAALIRAQWLVQEAASRHLSISPGELRKQIDRDTRSIAAEPRDHSGRARPNMAEIEQEARAQLASDEIRLSLFEGVPNATAAQVADYYRGHRSAYLIPERRYFYIDNLKSQAAALKVKAQVESGRSFARMALGEERTSAESFIPGREAIDRAILTAKPGVLSGPYLLSDVGDHSLFEVTKIVPSSYMPLSQVEHAIARQIVSALQRRVLAGFAKAWAARWKARTSCAPVYVIDQCRQYPSVGAPEQPF